jgi:hypothetical protein
MHGKRRQDQQQGCIDQLQLQAHDAGVLLLLPDSCRRWAKQVLVRAQCLLSLELLPALLQLPPKHCNKHSALLPQD